MYCTKCGIQNRDSASFCTKCGSNLSEQTPRENKASDKTQIYIQPDLDSKLFKIGSIFANRYEILDQGHVGGMGSVYKCKDTKLHDIIALKVILTKLLDSEQAVSRFRQEVAISRNLHHDNIVEVHDISEEKGIEYFTMEWIEGNTLRANIQERNKSNQPFSLEEAVEIISELSDALEYAHQYTIHRDIKPENILISRSKDFHLKLTDFGIAKTLTSSDLTRTNMQMGSPSYMAPEQKIDASNVDKRADIYAMGVILFELLTLENTIGLRLPSEINKKLPKEIDIIIKKAVEPNPDRRYQDAGSLCKAIKAIQKNINGTKTVDNDFDKTVNQETVNRSKDKAQKNTSKISILFIVVGMAVGIGTYIYFKKPDIFNILKVSNESPETLIKQQDVAGSKIIDDTRQDSNYIIDTQKQIKIASLINESDEYMKSQNYTSPSGKNALLSLREVLELDPDNQSAKVKIDEIRDIYMKWGRKALSKKELSKAKQHYDKVLLISPGFSKAAKKLEDIQQKQQLAIHYINSGRDSEHNNLYEDAIVYYNRAKHESQDEEIDSLLANVEKRIQENKNLMINKNNAEDLFKKAKKNEYAGNYEQALQDYESAKKLYPNIPDIDKNIITVESKILAEKKLLSKEKSITGKMVLVRGECFKMGDEFGDGARDEKPVHKVCLDDFYIGKNEVTQKQWKEVMGKNPAKFNNCGDNCPVEQVSWDSVKMFIKKLNEITVHTYRLPTEAEWEFACRSGGKKEKFSSGKTLGNVAWYDVNSKMKTHVVGKKISNSLGLNDMNGNVSEWVFDKYTRGYYKNSPQNNPKGPGIGSNRVARGGSWVDMADSIRCANRYKYSQDQGNSYFGFRLARTP